MFSFVKLSAFFTIRMIGGQRSYSERESRSLQSLLSDALKAEGDIGVYECRREAEEHLLKENISSGYSLPF